MSTPRRRQSQTLAVTRETFDEIATELKAAGFDSAIETENGRETVDMYGISLVRKREINARQAMNEIVQHDAPVITMAPEVLENAIKAMNQQAEEQSDPNINLVSIAVNTFNAMHNRRLITEAQGYTFMSLLAKVRMTMAVDYHHEVGQEDVMYSAHAAEAKSRQG